MSTYTASWKDGPFATVAAADTAIDGWITLVDTRFQAISGGDTATRGYGSIAATVKCDNGGATEYTFRFSMTYDTGTLAAGAVDAAIQTMVTSYSSLWTAVEGQSEYSTVLEVFITASLTLSD